ncbi:PulJ/GspJ family protein [Desulfoferrobacter suflitae]|uniref:PulJ/GspJ family protein n=1 Tax=Desulfoferrobacter suflitae TaxID=2865782 RepID=UPI002164C4DD|nr:type II secretion system protein [Desulfoferrobacter suflitae]MCK8600703.1 type II secretion system GspH family protein [Desulfoferrobacter suflitae]
MRGKRAAPKVLGQCRGFTLLELVLATLISTLVIGILSVALTFSLRMWERRQDQKPNEFSLLMELLVMQLAEFDATPVSSEFGAAGPLFVGSEHSLVVATDHSVKALSGGVPVVAKYTYLPQDKTLYYAEIPLDPYHHEELREFIEMAPDVESQRPRFYPVKVDNFALEYSGEEDEGYTNSWDDPEKLPGTVMVRWSLEETTASRIIVPDLLFPQSKDNSQRREIVGGS